jgi:hypothetical protein
VPVEADGTSCSIFIDSRMTTDRPALTTSLGPTSTSTTVPAIGETVGVTPAPGRRPPPAASGRPAVVGLLGRQVQRLGHRIDLRREPVGGHQPAHLELEPVGIVGVEGLGGAVVGRADQGPGVASLPAMRSSSSSVSTSQAMW